MKTPQRRMKNTPACVTTTGDAVSGGNGSEPGPHLSKKKKAKEPLKYLRGLQDLTASATHSKKNRATSCTGEMGMPCNDPLQDPKLTVVVVERSAPHTPRLQEGRYQLRSLLWAHPALFAPVFKALAPPEIVCSHRIKRAQASWAS